MQIKDTLFIIPARGGSKGLPRKNILPIAGKPMIAYTIDAARGVTGDKNICVSTDDHEIKETVEKYGLEIPFVRPPEFATDAAGTREVVLHAIDFYEKKMNRFFFQVCILQPTSPLRNSRHIKEAYQLWSDDLDMVVSVKETKANPYFNLFEENEEGLLHKCKEGMFSRRQDIPKVWQYNGAIYNIRTDSIKKKTIPEFERIKKYPMNENDSIDIDNEIDLELLKLRIKKESL